MDGRVGRGWVASRIIYSTYFLSRSYIIFECPIPSEAEHVVSTIPQIIIANGAKHRIIFGNDL
jgi:hypothetical protein